MRKSSSAFYRKIPTQSQWDELIKKTSEEMGIPLDDFKKEWRRDTPTSEMVCEVQTYLIMYLFNLLGYSCRDIEQFKTPNGQNFCSRQTANDMINQGENIFYHLEELMFIIQVFKTLLEKQGKIKKKSFVESL